jgi:hypothetical protein
MADNQVIGATLKVDATSAAAASKTIAEMKDNVKQLQKAFEETKAGSAEQAVAFKNLKAAQDELTKSTAAANKTYAETTGHFKNIKEGLGNVNPAFSSAGEGVGKLSSSFKALLANPVVLVITLIVGALALLYKAFTNTFEGGEKVEQIFAGIKAAGQALLDSLDKIGSAIIKVFTFDFSGAIEDIKAVGNAAANAFNEMSELTKQAQQLARDQATNDLEQVERQRKLAILREQANDETIPIAKRKAALLDLKKDSEQNAKDDIELARKIAENKIAQLTLEKDGEKKNFIEIQKIKADQLRGEIDNANELRRIDKQITSAEKQEHTERTEAAKAAAEVQKAEKQKLVEYTNKLLKLQQDNELAQLKDGYDKELKQLQNKLADEKRANDVAFKDKKITKAQLAELDNALDTGFNLQKAALDEKKNKDAQAKEVAFQKELNGIIAKIRLDGVVDTREQERVQLKIGYEEKLQDAIIRYKDDATKLQAIKQALDEQLRADQEKLDAKNAKEDAKKKFESQTKETDRIIADPTKAFADKQLALDLEVKANQAALDQKLISEQEYNDNVAKLAAARKEIKKQEIDLAYEAANVTTGLFDAVAEAAGKQTAVGKALSVASATINAIESAVKSFNAFASIPIVGPALGAVAAAAALVAGYNNVKKILSVQVPGQGSGGGASLPGITPPAAPVAPTQTGTQLDAKSLNTIGNAASRVYVLDADVTNNQERDERLNRAARLGN